MSIIEIRSTPSVRSLEKRRKSDLVFMIRDFSRQLGRPVPMVSAKDHTAYELARMVMDLLREFPEG